MSSTPRGTTPYYFVPGALAPSRRWRRSGLLFVIFGAAQWINGARLGQVVAAGRLPVAVRAAAPVVPRRDPRERRRPVRPQGRPLVPLEHELVHLLRGDVLRRLLHARCGGSRTHSVPALGGLDNALLWPDFKAVWPTRRRPASPARRPASSSRSRRWRRSGCRRSTPRCCCRSGVTVTIAHHALRANHRAADDPLDVAHGAAGRHLPRACRPTNTTTPTPS